MLEFRSVQKDTTGKRTVVAGLFDGDKKLGSAWNCMSDGSFCWSLHGDGRSIENATAESLEGAMTDLVAAVWRHIDRNAVVRSEIVELGVSS